MMLSATSIDVALRDRLVLRGVSVAITPGRITGIIGPNGAGKSTLLKSLAGLIPLRAGRVHLEGTLLSDLPGAELARQIAYLPQDRTVHWPLTVRAVAGLGRLPHRSSAAGESAWDREIIAAALTAMDVAALSDRPIDQISGGERARALFARALAQEAPVILADEPTAGLDPAHALDLFSTLDRLAAEGRAIALAIHDLSLAARFCHDVVILREGKVLAAGAAGGVMTAERISNAFGVHFRVGQFDNVPIVVPMTPLR